MNTAAVSMRLRSYPSGVKLILAVYALAFAFGTCVHVSILLHSWGVPPPHTLVSHRLVHRWLAYGYDTLAFFDPLVIFLLLRFPRTGLLLALGIMIADVGVNAFAAYMYLHPPFSWYAADYGAQANSVFLGFILGSAPLLWPYLGRKYARGGAGPLITG